MLLIKIEKFEKLNLEALDAKKGNLTKVKSEINSNRPVIVHYTSPSGGHSIIVHGYWGNRLVTNFGWGTNHAHKIINTNGNSFTGHRSGTIFRTDTLRVR